jgi:hypothetical protein
MARTEEGSEARVTSYVVDAAASEATRDIERKRVFDPVDEVDASHRGRFRRKGQLRSQLQFASGGDDLPRDAVQLETTPLTSTE